MGMVWEKYSGPLGEPVSLAEVRLHSLIDDTYQDAAVAGYLAAARAYVETITNRALMTRTVDVYLDDFPGDDCLYLPLGNLQSISTFEWIDSGGTTRSWTVSGSNLVDSSNVVRAHINTVEEPCEITLAYSQDWPTETLKTSNPIHLRIVCGWPAYSGTATCSGSTLTRSTGDTFSGALVGHSVLYQSARYTVLSVASDGATATLSAAPGTVASPAAWSGNTVPLEIKQALLMLTAWWYSQRESATVGNTASIVSGPVAMSVDALLASHRLYLEAD
jgi:hypothetical protein